MKTLALFTIVTLAIVGVLVATVVTGAKAAEEKKPVVRHVVLFKFKDGTTPEQIKAVENGFRQLPGKISEIKDFEWGTNVSPENKAEGFTHCFMVTFADEKGRDAYLPHPAHKEFAQSLGSVLDKVLVIDYLAQK